MAEGTKVGAIYYSVDADTSKLVNSTQSVDKALGDMEDALKGADRASDKLTGTQKQMGGALSGTGAKLRETAKAAKEATTGFETAASGLSSFAKVALAYLSLQTLRSLAELADAYGQNADRIKNATSSAEEYNRVQERLLATANGTYRALGEVQEVYLATSDVLRDLKYSTEEVLDITDSLAYAFVRDAARADQATSAMDAYSKALQKGKLDADAWATVMAATPSIVTGIAEATGKTGAEIRKLGAEGKLSVEALNEGLLASLDANKAAADAMGVSVKDATTQITNALTVFVGKANEASGASSVFTNAAKELSDVLQDPATIDAATALATGVVKAFGLIAKAARTTVGVVKWMAEETAAAMHGAAPDDVVRLTGEIEKLQRALDVNKRDPEKNAKTIAYLEREIARRKELISLAQAPAAKPAAAPPTVPGKPRPTVAAAAPDATKAAGAPKVDPAIRQAQNYLDTLQKQAAALKGVTAQERLQYDILVGNVKLQGEQLDIATRYAKTIDATENIAAFQKMGEALGELNLSSRELALNKAAASLNSFATPEEVAKMREMAGLLWDANAAQERRSQLASVDPMTGANASFANDMLLFAEMLENKELLEQEYDALRLARVQEFEAQKLAIQEETFRKQSEWNNLLMDGIDALGSTASANLLGILQGTTSITDAARQLGATVLNSVIQSFVQMGIEYVKSMVMGKSAEAAATGASVAAAAVTAAAWAPAAAMVSLASFGANSAPASAGITSTAALAKGLSLAGGRQYGGGVAAGSLYRVNENGAPEVFNAANGRQYMLPNTRGEVVSNADATAGVSRPVAVTVQLIGSEFQNAEITQDYDAVNEETILRVVAASLARRSPVSQAGEQYYGWRRQGT